MRIFRRKAPPPGSRPGTLTVSEEATPIEIDVVRYNADACEFHEKISFEELDRLVTPPGEWTIWVDVEGLGDIDLLLKIGDRFQFHPLLLEDLVHVPQRPKVDVYDTATLIVTRMLRFDADADADAGLDVEQVSLVLVDNVVLTFQERSGDVFDPVRLRLRDGQGRMRQMLSSYLAYALLDAIIDGYFPVLEELGEAIENIVDRLLEEPDRDVLRDITSLRSDLLSVRRAVLPQRDAVAQLVSGEIGGFEDFMTVFTRDVHDHAVQTADVVESYRELVSGLLNTYLTVVSNRTNEVMRVLTIMASIFIPLTFMAGVYGMNFEHMPELKFAWGYPALLGAMVTVAGGMIWWFRRNKWL